SRTSWPGGFCADQGAGNLERGLSWRAPLCRIDRPAPPPTTGHNTSRFSRCQRFRGSHLVRPFDMREISTDPLSMHDIQGRPTVAEVSLGALRTNLRAARDLVGPGVKVLAVVKADGYGHGAVAAARAQVERFRAAVEALAAAGVRPAEVHLANSAAVLSTPAAHFTMVRPGIMLYGYAPAPHLRAQARLLPAMRLQTRIAQTRRVAAG